MSATTDEKIRNALNMYNGGLQTKLTNKFVAQVNGKTLSTNDFTDALKNKLDAVATDTYVQKVTGKNLSTNDFTDALKEKLEGLSSVDVDLDTLTDTFVVKVSGKNLSTNDFTDDYKAKLDSLSTDTQTVDLTGVMRVYIGSVAPTDTSVIWFDTSAYSN